MDTVHSNRKVDLTGVKPKAKEDLTAKEKATEAKEKEDRMAKEKGAAMEAKEKEAPTEALM